MADNRTETPAADSSAAGKGTDKPAAAGSRRGGFAAWLPLILTIVAMPALAYATTTYFIVPQIQRATGNAGTAHAQPSARGNADAGAHGTQGGSRAKHSVALSKMIVNVAGTMGTRYLLTSLTLVGSSPDIKDLVEEHRDHLLDVATSNLSNKTIADLEKPGARNQVRSELMAAFNTVFGAEVVTEIFITEFAIQ
jgi:flagellar FliL protein